MGQDELPEFSSKGFANSNELMLGMVKGLLAELSQRKTSLAESGAPSADKGCKVAEAKLAAIHKSMVDTIKMVQNEEDGVTEGIQKMEKALEHHFKTIIDVTEGGNIKELKDDEQKE